MYFLATLIICLMNREFVNVIPVTSFLDALFKLYGVVIEISFVNGRFIESVICFL